MSVLLLASAGGAGAQGSGWSTTEVNGVQWLVSPDGKLLYSKGVNFVDPGKETAQSLEKKAFYWKNFFPSLDQWHRTVGAQLTGWGFNTRGGWSDPSPDIALALTVDLELGRNSKFHWFDPFDPAMEQKTLQWAEKLTAPYRNDPHLLGYFTDNEVGWWNSPLFGWYIAKGWDNHTKRVLWQLVTDHYAGQWQAFLRDWAVDPSVRSFEDLKRADIKIKLKPGGDGFHLVDRFMYLCAHHYYALMSKAIHQAHPGALVLGDRLPLYYHQDAVLAIGDSLDVVSTNYNVDVPDGWVAPYYFDGLRRLTRKPVLVTEFFFAAKDNRSGNRNETARNIHPKPGHLMTVATQDERARGVASALRNFASFPNVVGAHWFQYCDEPFGGREDGEDYNMGLIDNANRPYEEVTDVFRRSNPQLETVHRNAIATASGSEGSPVRNTAPSEAAGGQTLGIPRAARPIDVSDQSLMDWDKAETRLQDFQTPKPYVPFGDVHLAWTPEGLYLATLANTYVDPNFLAHEGNFPDAESFQIHLMVEARGKPYHFAIYLPPKPDSRFADGFEIAPRVTRITKGKPAELLPAKGHVQRLDKSLPHMAVEAFFPARWFGLERLEPGMKLRMNIALRNYYRELTMTWSGTPSLEQAEDSRSLRTVFLEGPDTGKQAQARLE